MSSGFIHVVSNNRIFIFLWANNTPWYTYRIFYPFIHRHLGSFYVLAVVDNAALNIWVQISLPDPDLIFFGYKPWGGIAQSYGSPMVHFFRNLHPVFHSGYTNLFSHQKCTGFPFLHTRANTGFLMTAMLTGSRWYVTVVLICIFLMLSDAEHPFLYLLATCMSSLEKCLFMFSANFLIRFFAIELYEFLIYFGYYPFMRQMICKYFLPLCMWLLAWYSSIIDFLLLLLLLVLCEKNHCWDVFRVSGLMFSSLIH